jgi:hypothetical protein
MKGYSDKIEELDEVLATEVVRFFVILLSHCCIKYELGSPPGPPKLALPFSIVLFT